MYCTVEFSNVLSRIVLIHVVHVDVKLYRPLSQPYAQSSPTKITQSFPI